MVEHGALFLHRDDGACVASIATGWFCPEHQEYSTETEEPLWSDSVFREQPFDIACGADKASLQDDTFCLQISGSWWSVLQDHLHTGVPVNGLL
jgi:hypothetical protein